MASDASGIGGIISAGGVFARGYAHIVLKDITPRQGARKPRFDTPGQATVIDTNHPVFLYGHLALYPTRIFTLTGGNGTSIEAPPAWNDLFKAGAPCHDDPEGTIYPSLDAVTSHFFTAHDAAVAHARTVADDIWLRPNPNEQSRDRFPTVGAVANFLLVGHVMMHMGQLSAWRRCMGLPSAMG